MLASVATPVTASVTRLRYKPGSLTAYLPERRDDFRELVRSYRLRWNGATWERVLGDLNGDPQHRAAELGRALLAAGFPVDFPDQETADLAVSGEYAPEITRWVLAGANEFTGWLRLRWSSKDDLWSLARMLPGNRYDPDTASVMVPPDQWQEVIGFAEIHDFTISAKAQEIIDQARKRAAGAWVVELAERKPKKKVKRGEDAAPVAKFLDAPARQIAPMTDLYPHQARAVDKLLPLKLGALFMDMGTGKTRTAIELVIRRQARLSRVVWFCPVSLKLTIAYEIEKHARGEAVCVFDDETRQGAIPEAFWYVVGVESMSSSDRVVLAVHDLIDQDTFVIVDESSYIKGPSSIRTQRITSLAERARYRLLLTGTPLSQGVEDLYAQMRFLDWQILGYKSFYAFADAHLIYSDKFPGMVSGTRGVKEITDRIEPFVFQITKAESLDLPEKLYDAVYFGLTQPQRDAYEQAKYEILLGVPEDLIDSYTIFRLFTALQQIVSGFWNREGQLLEFFHQRIEQLMHITGAVPDGEKVIVWCKFVHSLAAIAAALETEHGAGCTARYYGELSEQERDAEITRFRGPARFLVATQATGGHGLTLTEAHYAVFYENGFKYSERMQAEDRIHRIGQTEKVTYIDLVARWSIDERIQAALARKEDVVKSFKRGLSSAQELKKAGTKL
jgi:SNF2 family DNA or RNA helicase